MSKATQAVRLAVKTRQGQVVLKPYLLLGHVPQSANGVRYFWLAAFKNHDNLIGQFGPKVNRQRLCIMSNRVSTIVS